MQFLFSKHALDSLPSFLYKYIEESICPSTTESMIMHDLSKSEIVQILTFIENTINFNHKLPQIKYKRIANINKKLTVLNELYKSSIKEHNLDDLIETINKSNSEIIESENKLFVKTAELDRLYVSLEQITIDIKTVQEKLIRATKDENVFNITQKIERVINSYKKIILNKRYVEIESYFLEMFQKLIRKNSFIKSVSLDTDTFDIIMYDKEDHRLTKENLSAGESQIYILSFIWAIINTSKREFPLIFDTLLGRLDLVHKNNILSHLLPNAGKQVIILSTNTEITPEAYKQIKPYVAKEYLLTFDNENKQAKVDSKYFFEVGD